MWLGARYVAVVTLGPLVLGCGGPAGSREREDDSVAATQNRGADVCRHQPPACARALELGVTLPSSTAQGPLVAGELVIVSPNAVVVTDTTVTSLREGVPRTGEFEGHVSASFAAALEGHSTEGPLTLLADHQTPFSTVADLMFTAHRIGAKTEFQLAVVRDGVLGGLRLYPPREWMRPPIGPNSAESTLVVELEGSTARFRLGDRAARVELDTLCEGRPGTCVDLEVVRQTASEWKRDLPTSTAVTLRVAPHLSVQNVVGVIDALRGPDCADDEQAWADATRCMFPAVAVDPQPGLYWYVHEPPSITLGLPREGEGKRWRQLEASVVEHQAAIVACLNERRELWTQLRPDLEVVLISGPLPGEPATTALAASFLGSGALADGMFAACFNHRDGVVSIGSDPRGEFLRDQDATLIVPIRFADAPVLTGP